MDQKCSLTPQDWALLRKMGDAKKIPIGSALIKKIKGGSRRWTEDAAVAIHRATEGAIPCWVLRPDRWAPGQLPPSLADMAA